MTKLLAASILSANLLNLKADVLELERAKVDMLHIDVMDGDFVPNISFGPNIVETLKQNTKLLLDVHLMISKPERHIESFIQAGADMITVHLEATTHINRVIDHIKSAKIKAGVALLPSTLPSSIDFLIDQIDLVLVMSVNPGFGGQKFITNQLEKIKVLSDKLMPGTILGVDGGINEKTAPLAVNVGANLIVSGSYIYQDNTICANVSRLRAAL
jgi:ribulose-phosphate 3-epimerase